jgi:hypothetical protein
VYYYTSGTLEGLHGTIGTLNGSYGTIGTVNGTLNGSNGERNGERFARNVRTENGWNGLNALASISKFAFRKLSLSIIFIITICLFIYKY